MSTKKISEDDLIQKETPPNGVSINEKMFCDQTEITNFNWLEYMFWTKRTYGSQSPEFRNTQIDSLVWLESDSCAIKYVDYYLRHPAYRDFPLVGITQSQAEDYSKWRSDRVFEYMLIRDGIIHYNESQNRENVFTIENFFNNKIERLNTEREIVYYPEFRLPNEIERVKILSYSDSLDDLYSNQYYTKYPKSNEVELIHFNIKPCINDTMWSDPTRPVRSFNHPKKIAPIMNLKGNVSEWAFEKNLTFGGNWGSDSLQINQSDKNNSYRASKYIGFRNVCEYKKWNEGKSL